MSSWIWKVKVIDFESDAFRLSEHYLQHAYPSSYQVTPNTMEDDTGAYHFSFSSNTDDIEYRTTSFWSEILDYQRCIRFL